jgi:ESS family glutamate:Na+ symporter
MQDILTDIGIISILLLAAFFIRRKIRLFQTLYIPDAVIAGFLGLLLGPNVLGKFSPIYLPFSEGSAGYAMVLLVVVFTTLCVGAKFDSVGEVVKYSFQALCLGSTLLIGQGLLGYGVVKVLQATGSDIMDGFALLPSTGFYGGHGLGAMVAVAWENISYWNTEEVMSIATTFATIGLLYGIIGGISFINIGARKGYLKNATSMDQLSEEELTGYIPPEKRKGIISGVSTPAVLEPLSLQLAFVMIIFVAAIGLTNLCSHFPYLNKLNSIACVALMSALFAFLFRKIPALDDLVDPQGMRHISSTAMELLIVASISNTNLSVVASYLKEIMIASVIILPISTAVCYFMAKKICPKDWFEFFIFFFGTSTGVVATGFMLLKIADPEAKSYVWLANAIPIGALISIVVQPMMLSVAPVMLVSNPGTLVIIMTAAILVFVVSSLLVQRTLKA